MARTVATRIRFVELPTGDPRSVLLAVEVHRGSRSTTVGRISAGRGDNGRPTGWAALRVGGYMWTPFYGTRKAAVADMLGLVDVNRERLGAISAGVPFVAPVCVEARATVLEAVEAALDGRELGDAEVVALPTACDCRECRWERGEVEERPWWGQVA